MVNLTRIMDNANKNTSGNDTILENPVNFENIIQKIHDTISMQNGRRKSKLIAENVTGIIIGNAFNNQLQDVLGHEFRLDILDKLIDDKSNWVLSVDGSGVNQIIRGLSVLQPNVVGAMPPTLIERATGIQGVKEDDDK